LVSIREALFNFASIVENKEKFSKW